MTTNDNVHVACAAMTDAFVQLFTALREGGDLDPSSSIVEIERDEDTSAGGSSRLARIAPSPHDATDAAASERRLFIYLAAARGLANLTQAH